MTFPFQKEMSPLLGILPPLCCGSRPLFDLLPTLEKSWICHCQVVSLETHLLKLTCWVSSALLLGKGFRRRETQVTQVRDMPIPVSVVWLIQTELEEWFGVDEAVMCVCMLGICCGCCTVPSLSLWLIYDLLTDLEIMHRQEDMTMWTLTVVGWETFLNNRRHLNYIIFHSIPNIKNNLFIKVISSENVLNHVILQSHHMVT